MPAKALHRSACFTLAALTLAAAGVVQADPTDYITVPTAEVLAPGRYNFELVQTLDWIDSDRDEGTFLLSEFGITEQLEVGLDINSIGNDAFVEADIKYQLAAPSKNEWGLAVGALGIGGEEVDTFVYLSATRDIGKASVTAGAGSRGDVSAFFGASYPVTDRFKAIGEFFTDDESDFALAGAAYKLTDHLTAAAWYQDFNESEEERVQLDLIYQGRF
jgi:hypothetical protein